MQSSSFATYTYLFAGIMASAFSLFLCGCGTKSSTLLVPKYKEPSCTTTISGKFNVPLTFPEMRAMIIITERGNTKKVSGEYIAKESDGIRFKPDNGWANTTGEKVYKFNEVLCALDSNGKTLYGSLPDKYQNQHYNCLIQLKNKQGESVEMVIETNEQFCYCINSGSYEIQHIILNPLSLNGGYVSGGVQYLCFIRGLKTISMIADKDNPIPALRLDTPIKVIR